MKSAAQSLTPLSAVLIIYQKDNLLARVKDVLPSHITALAKTDIQSIPYMLCTYHIVCVIIALETILPQDSVYIKYTKKNFPNIPWIILIDQPNMEFACQCGSWGIEHVCCHREISHLTKTVDEIIQRKHTQITLKEIGIDKQNASYSHLLQRALNLIEEHYIQIMKVNTLSDLLQISESTLIRIFQQYELPSPKKILMFLKTKHATKLMHNKNLTNCEIAHLSGFTNVKRMTECFQRTFNITPGKYKANGEKPSWGTFTL